MKTIFAFLCCMVFCCALQTPLKEDLKEAANYELIGSWISGNTNEEPQFMATMDTSTGNVTKLFQIPSNYTSFWGFSAYNHDAGVYVRVNNENPMGYTSSIVSTKEVTFVSTAPKTPAAIAIDSTTIYIFGIDYFEEVEGRKIGVGTAELIMTDISSGEVTKKTIQIPGNLTCTYDSQMAVDTKNKILYVAVDMPLGDGTVATIILGIDTNGNVVSKVLSPLGDADGMYVMSNGMLLIYSFMYYASVDPHSGAYKNLLTIPCNEAEALTWNDSCAYDPANDISFTAFQCGSVWNLYKVDLQKGQVTNTVKNPQIANFDGMHIM